MSKNLYKLECPVSSQYNYETKEDGKLRAYIQLLPGNSTPAPQTMQEKHGVTNFAVYYTNNPETFWAAPPVDAAPAAAAAVHGNADYENVLAKFKNFYNQNQTDSICDMFSDTWGDRKKSLWTADRNKNIKDEYGNMISYKYIATDDGDGDNDVILFKTVFDNSVHMLGISIDKNNKIVTFRFETSSPYIDKLLAKEM